MATVASGTLFAGDSLGGGSYAFTDRNVGNTNKTVTVSGVAVNDGNGGANYKVSYASNTSSTITVRPLSTWTAPGDGQWSTPGNWDALPDGSNVLAVSIPAGVAVAYDPGAGATSLQSVNSAGAFALTGGNLSIAGSLSTPQYTQSGGALSVANAINVNGSFNQSAGTIAAGGPVTIVQNSGNLIVGTLQAPAISLSALNGNIGQTAGLTSSGVLTTQSSGSTVLNDGGNRLSSFKAASTGAGNIELTNVGALDVQGISTVGGNIRLHNTGGISTSGLVQANGGAVSMTANSPLTIGAAGVVASGDILLTATNLTSAGNLTLNGDLTSTAGGITLDAANNFVQNSALTAALGIAVSAGGDLTLGPLASSVGHPVLYKLNGQTMFPPAGKYGETPAQVNAPVDFLVTFLDKFEQAITRQELVVEDPRRRSDKDRDAVVVEAQICTP